MTKSKKWEIWKTYGPPHVVPQDDLKAHDIGMRLDGSPVCWCAPYRDDGVIVHNSADQRELSEPGYERRGGKQ